MMVAIMIMVSPEVIVVVLMVPMSLVHSPAFAIVVIMRMAPVCPFIWRTVPASPDPPVMVTNRFPISIHPDEVWTWRRSPLLIADRRCGGPDRDRNLSPTRRAKNGSRQFHTQPHY